MKIFSKTLTALKKTKENIRNVFSGIVSFSNINENDLNSIEESLLSSDIGWELTEKIVAEIKSNEKNYESWEELLIETLGNSIEISEYFSADKLKKVIIVIGVNGSGKTTSSAKLAQYYKKNNLNVSLVAADTYRAAAIEQLKIWSDRLGVDFISNFNTSDPASVAFDGINSGIAKNHDHIIIDTAGRLHTSKNLMLELQKLYRISSKITDDISVCISLDGNVGQNGIKQVQEFNEYLPVDSIILNKMDGTAKGGIALAILDKLSIPISFIGVGESYDDFIVFKMNEYLHSLVKEG